MKVYKEKQLGAFEAFFYTIFLWSGTAVFTVFFSFLDVLVMYPLATVFDRDARGILHKVSILWARGIIRLSPIWKLAVTGLGNLKKDTNYVVVANHQSLIDILAVCAALPLNFKFLAKKELFQIPFMGWAMAAAGYIPLDRSSHESGRRAMKQISFLLSKNISVLLFPEGTRSPDGKIHSFKPGAFKLAHDCKVEILPVVVDGTGRALPKKRFSIRNRSKFVVSIGKPVRVEAQAGRTIEEIKEAVRHEMIARLAKIRHQGQG